MTIEYILKKSVGDSMKNKPNCVASGHFPSSVERMGKMTKISSQMTRRVSCFGHWRHYIAMKRHTCLKLCHILSSRTKDGGVTAKCQHSTTGAGCWKIRTLHTPVSDFTLVVLQPYCVTMAGKVYVCNSFLPKGHVNPSTKLNQEIRYKGLPLDVRF